MTRVYDPDIVLSNAEILEIFRHKCVVDRKPTRTIHESPPRSLLPNGEWKKLRFRFPICSECHELAHREGTGKSHSWLIEARRLRMDELDVAFSQPDE